MKIFILNLRSALGVIRSCVGVAGIVCLTGIACVSVAEGSSSTNSVVALGVVHAGTTFTTVDPASVVGYKRCSACHQSEIAAWETTPHSKSYKNLRNGKSIAVALDIKKTYRKKGMCVECHALPIILPPKNKLKQRAVSCESCHGPAQGWIETHNKYGPGATRETESDEHRAERWKQADDNGMIRKDRVHLIAANCYGCHEVLNEELVNVGGHHKGSDFELVAWSQGMVRHNFFNNPKNQPASAERTRVLYVVGQTVGLEFALRGLANATADGPFRTVKQQRVANAVKNLKQIVDAADLPELGAIMALVPMLDSGEVDFEQLSALLETLPDQFAGAAQAFVEAHDGTGLGGIEALSGFPKPGDYRGQPHQP